MTDDRDSDKASIEQAVEGGGRLRVQVVPKDGGRFGYVAQFGYKMVCQRRRISKDVQFSVLHSYRCFTG